MRWHRSSLPEPTSRPGMLRGMVPFAPLLFADPVADLARARSFHGNARAFKRFRDRSPLFAA